MWSLFSLLLSLSLASQSNSFCTAIFDRGISDMNLNMIEQMRDGEAKDMAKYLKQVPAFSAFSKDELLILAGWLRSDHLKDQATDAILESWTSNMHRLRRELQEVIVGRDSQIEEKMRVSIEEPSLKADRSQPLPVVEAFVNVGDIGQARIAHGLYRYMLIQVWEGQHANTLRYFHEKNIEITKDGGERGILIAMHPKDILLFTRRADLVRELQPFTGVAESF